MIDGKRIKTTDLDLIFAAAKAKDQRRLKLDEFLNKALVALAGKRYPWLENTDGEGPACKEFIRQHIFKWDVCSDFPRRRADGRIDSPLRRLHAHEPRSCSRHSGEARSRLWRRTE